LELEMRPLILFGISAMLVTALFFLWQFRFERVSGYPALHLGDFRNGSQLPPGAAWAGTEERPVLRLSAEEGNRPVVLKLDLPKIAAVDYLHVTYRIAASNLILGKERWEDGRGIIDWRPQAAGGKLETDPIFSLCGNYASKLTEQVMRPEEPPAEPSLRFENLGASGAFEISHLEITVVRERWFWKTGYWFLILGCFAWAAAWCGWSGKSGVMRSSAAALVWLLMLIYFVVPGPWKSLRPLGAPFKLGDEIAAVHVDAEPPSVPVPAHVPGPAQAPQAALPSAGKIPDKGDFTLWIKSHAAKARPLLHVILLFGPTLLIACLVGKSPAASLGIILSIAIEAAQAGFGYGFDRADVADLTCDAMGIALGLMAASHPWLRTRFRWSRENPCRSVPVE